MKKLFFASLFFSCASLVQTQVPSLKEGIKHLENENFSAALTTFNAIAKNDPKNGTIYYYIGQVSYLTDEFAVAEKSYKKGLTINGQCAECKIGLGQLLLDQGKTSEAEEHFTSATRLDKRNPEIFAFIGDAYLYGKNPNPQKASEYLLTATNMNPKEAKYLTHLGDAYRLSGNNGEAMTSYERAVEKDPNNTEAYISMARIWAAAKQYDIAIVKLNEAIKISPDDARTYKDLIELYIRTGEYDKVTPLLDKYVSLTGTDVEAKVRLVKFLTFQAKDYERAIEEGEKLLKINPEQYTLHRWLAWAYYETGKYQESYDKSKQLFDAIGKKEGRASFPSDYEYWAKAAFKLGLLDEAAPIYKKYLEFDPSRSQEILGQLAKAFFDAKNYERAIVYYNRKGAEKPLSVADDYYLGYAYYYADHNLEADSAFARVLKVTPDYAPAWLMRANIAQILDTTKTKQFLAREFYENYIIHALKDTLKNKDKIIEAAEYVAYSYSQEFGDPVAKARHELKYNEMFTQAAWDKYCVSKATEYYELVLQLDPGNDLAASNLRLVKDLELRNDKR